MPQFFSILPLIEYGFGVWHPKGGCGQDAVAVGSVRALGGTIRLDSPVSGLVPRKRVMAWCCKMALNTAMIAWW